MARWHDVCDKACVGLPGQTGESDRVSYGALVGDGWLFFQLGSEFRNFIATSRIPLA